MPKTIVQIALPTPIRRLFDYFVPENVTISPQVGARVQVLFNRRSLVGIIINITTTSSIAKERLKPIIAILDEQPIVDHEMMTLCKWASDYYHYSLGEVFMAALPKPLREGKSCEASKDPKAIPEVELDQIFKPKFPLNAEQQSIVDEIQQSVDEFKVWLLYGVTGSGKTEIYAYLVAEQLKRAKQCLILIPEIGLAPQMQKRFTDVFNVPIVIVNSTLTGSQRYTAWLSAQSKQAAIIIGTRSAIFTPLPNLGLIIIDEEHDVSFKQQDTFRYSARDLAIIRAKMRNIPILLGSATPSLESLHNADRGRYQLLTLPQRVGNAVLPVYHVVDLRNQRLQAGLSSALIQAIGTHLQQGNQILIFVNRRGYAPVLMCHSCGWIAECGQCDSRLTLHQSPSYLQCHHCSITSKVPIVCPHCFQTQLLKLGVGTERLAETLLTLFPGVEILRIDRDSTRRKDSLSKMLKTISKDEPKILIGTQMLAKGHHFPGVTLVGIINLDAGFYSSDFRALERTAQLMIQVAGRAGRADKPGSVYIQTHHPNYPLLLQLLEQGYLAFANALLTERKLTQLPPFSYHALLRVEVRQVEQGKLFLENIKKKLENLTDFPINVMGPMLAPVAKRSGYYRVFLLFQASTRRLLQDALIKLDQIILTIVQQNKVKWLLEVDPWEMN